MNEKVLLLGNGINDVDIHYQWKDLINNLIAKVGGGVVIKQDKQKPFPLLYEEIFVRAVNMGWDEIKLKSFIAEDVSNLVVTDVHRKILSMNIQDIVTTNYDFTLEKVIAEEPDSLLNSGLVNEKLYSIFRHFEIDKRRFWHVHGDANYPKSINLGYEHYSGSLQHMRNYVVSGPDYTNVSKKSLIKRIKAGEPIEITSWIDHFFLNNIYIVGLTLDFIEIDLWWLLTIRKRSSLNSSIPINNKIVYFYPASCTDKIKHKLQVLNSLGVKTTPCDYNATNKLSYYKEVLRIIEND